MQPIKSTANGKGGLLYIPMMQVCSYFYLEVWPHPMRALTRALNFVKSSTQALVKSGIKEFGFGVPSSEKQPPHIIHSNMPQSHLPRI